MQTINMKSRILLKDELSVAFGYFDGIHLGHLELFNKTLELSRKNNTKSAIISFHPNPKYVLQKTTEQTSLTSNEDKEKLLSDLGFDYLIIIDFTLELAKLDHKSFIKNLLSRLNIKDIVLGFDYKYGHKGEGSTSTIVNDFERPINLIVIDEYKIDGEKVGTSRIKSLLLEGNIEKTSKLLGRNYSINGTVVHGRGLGRTIGFPTANIALTFPYNLPKNGVYNTFVYINNEKYLGILNIGNNPTFNYQEKKSIEVNILDFNKDIYGTNIRIEFLDFVRDEKKFDSIDELKKEINKNKENLKSKHLL